ncbi:MAG: hypothetical protein WCF25_07905 [Acidimicrobiales bacterium]
MRLDTRCGTGGSIVEPHLAGRQEFREVLPVSKDGLGQHLGHGRGVKVVLPTSRRVMRGTHQN